MKRALVGMVVCATALAGCGHAQGAGRSSATATASVSHEPGVVLSLPPSMTAGEKGEAVIESYGHAGEIAQLYAFPEGFGKTSPCTDPKASYHSVQLVEGRQVVSLNYDQPGDTTVVLIGKGWQTKCGSAGSVIRVLSTTKIDVWAQTTAAKGKPFAYKIAAGTQPTPPLTEWDVTVRWLGPYQSAPEAKAQDCGDAQPVAYTTPLKVTQGTGAWGEGVRPVETTPTAPGVYRLVATVAGGQYNAESRTVCGAAPLVAVS